jgi:ABC-type proline/glycine betaine transport system ATPase subunit
MLSTFPLWNHVHLILEPPPRLRDSKILMRMLTVIQFGKLMSVRNMPAEDFIEGYIKQFSAARSSFKEKKYNEDQKKLLRKNKKEILKLAVVDAEKLYQELSWRSN